MVDLFIIEFERTFKELKSYKLNMLLANISLLIMFSGLLEYSDAGLSAQTQISIMLAWYSCVHSIANPTYIIEEEIMDGTLINILSSKQSLFSIINIRNLVQYVTDVVKIIIVLILLILITGVEFTFIDLTIMFSMITLLTLISHFIGIILGAVTLLYTKTSYLIEVFYYGILFFSGGLFIIKNDFLNIINTLFPFQTFNNFVDGFYINGFVDKGLLMILAIQLFVYGVVSYYLLKRNLGVMMKKGVVDYV